MASHADDATVQRFAVDPRAGLADLVRTYQVSAVRYCQQLVGSAEDAEDVSQRGFLRVYDSGVRFESAEHFRAYFFRVLTHLCYDELRKRKRVRQIVTQAMPEEAEFHSAAAPPDRQAIGGELDALLQSALRSLSESERAVLHLREVERLSYRRISESLGITASEAGVMIHRARVKIQARIQPFLDEE